MMRTLGRFLPLTKSLFEIWWPIVKPMAFAVCILLLALVMVPFLGRMLISLPVFNPIEQIATPRTQIITNTLPLRAVGYWSTKEPLDHLRIADGNLVVIGVLGFRGHNLVVLDARTGDFFWKEVPNMRSLDADQNRVYAGRVTNIQAHDLRTGQKLWEYKDPSKSRGSMYVSVEGDEVKVRNYYALRDTVRNLTLDAQTGELLSAGEETPQLFLPREPAYKTARNTQLEYKIQSDGSLVGIDTRTGQEIGHLDVTAPSIHDKVAASDEFLVIYHDNNRELLVFRQEN
jgi:hypothetical protein